MLFEIWKNLDKSTVIHILLVEEQTTQKIKMYKTLIKLRFTKINPREKSTGSQFMKLNPCKMLKIMTRKNKSTRKFLSLR